MAASPQTITPADAYARSAAGTLDLIDVRSTTEFAGRHARGTRSMPAEILDPAALAAAGRPVAIICQAGVRSAAAAGRVAAAGLNPVYSVAGGTTAWAAAGLPTDGTGGGGVSIERQVRMAAGGLVAAGSAAAILVHPAFVAVPLVVGSALVVTALLNWCGLALLLARMPWNHVRP